MDSDENHPIVKSCWMIKDCTYRMVAYTLDDGSIQWKLESKGALYRKGHPFKSLQIGTIEYDDDEKYLVATDVVKDTYLSRSIILDISNYKQFDSTSGKNNFIKLLSSLSDFSV